jgi:formylglycine-generating enzyme required for sulfatase activity
VKLNCTYSSNYYFLTCLLLLFVISPFSAVASVPVQKLWLEVDQPGALVYVDGVLQGSTGFQGMIELKLTEGKHHLFIEKVIDYSVYSYHLHKVINVGKAPLSKIKLYLTKGVSPAWLQHFHQLLASSTQTLDIEKQLAMVDIPAGEFIMGSNDVMFARPAHPQSVSAFRISRYELTFDLYDQFVMQTGYDIPDDDGWGRGNRPVINVSWEDAQFFIQWLNAVVKPDKPYRLPTEKEWEYAARSGTDTYYWWGDDPKPNMANCSDCGSFLNRSGYRETAPVGSFRPNHFGLHDMTGNVYEWVQDCWISRYDNSDTSQVGWPGKDCKYRVKRGGCWYFNQKEIGSASRTWSIATSRDSTRGFRLAQDK